jgi:uncharacterized 2Fe-2S/4Fe-4S cluster protein (DUF4445 family)
MKIRLAGTGKSIDAATGENLLAALKRAGEYLIASCGGKGICGKCKVKLLGGSARVKSAKKLSEEEKKSGFVLSCQTYPQGDLVIEIPETSRLVVGEKIALSRSEDLLGLLRSFGHDVSPMLKEVSLEMAPPSLGDSLSDLERLRKALSEAGFKDGRMAFSHNSLVKLGGILRQADWRLRLSYIDGETPRAVSISPITSRKTRFGLAVDIGTTTIVGYLVDLKTGRLVDVGSTYNSQMRHGDDVITRIVFASEGGGLGQLRSAVLDDINGIIKNVAERHNIAFEDIELAVISGNTTMEHLFWGIDPASIREEPYVPAATFFPVFRGAEAALRMNPEGPVYTVPSVASYVGGDIVAGVLASRMHLSDEIALFMDIGTNGEIAIGNREWLITAACSAGPCFEGSGILHGMRATEGAIESVRITPELEVETGVIGNGATAPRGICGSGMIDAISQMFLRGIINPKGGFIMEVASRTGRLREGPYGTEFLLAGDIGTPSGPITLTGPDIENVLRAKAAIYAGVSVLLREVGLAPDAIRKVYIAGGFGNFLDVEKAIILGMLPDMPLEKFVFLGNTSVTGAYLCLVSDDLRKEAESIAARMTYMELSVSRAFMDEYMSALFLPHTDINRFPTVKDLIEKNAP